MAKMFKRKITDEKLVGIRKQIRDLTAGYKKLLQEQDRLDEWLRDNPPLEAADKWADPSAEKYNSVVQELLGKMEELCASGEGSGSFGEKP